MFTGIVEEVGAVVQVEDTGDGVRIHVACDVVTADATLGASIAVSGVCLTVTELTDRGFTADLAASTLAVTSLRHVAPGDAVNLERPLAADGRFGGHLVQGHVDGVGRVVDVREEPGTRFVAVAVPAELRRFLVPKGSVTVDGVSLTIADMTAEGFEVALIPHTCVVTTLGAVVVGDDVNLEVDVIAKYVANHLEAYTGRLVSQPGGTT